MTEAAPSTMAQSWPWGSQIAVKKIYLLWIHSFSSYSIIFQIFCISLFGCFPFWVQIHFPKAIHTRHHSVWICKKCFYVANCYDEILSFLFNFHKNLQKKKFKNCSGLMGKSLTGNTLKGTRNETGNIYYIFNIKF